MQDKETVSGILEMVGRLPSSTLGNPRYEVIIKDGHPLPTIYCTTPNASLGYSITKFEGKYVQAVVGLHYGKPSIETVKEIEPEYLCEITTEHTTGQSIGHCCTGGVVSDPTETIPDAVTAATEEEAIDKAWKLLCEAAHDLEPCRCGKFSGFDKYTFEKWCEGIAVTADKKGGIQ
tara:strand:- start:142 stop:669 length:528 start_codon:yes stop_codon:yes gene_type:complete